MVREVLAHEEWESKLVVLELAMWKPGLEMPEAVKLAREDEALVRLMEGRELSRSTETVLVLAVEMQ